MYEHNIVLHACWVCMYSHEIEFVAMTLHWLYCLYAGDEMVDAMATYTCIYLIQKCELDSANVIEALAIWYI